ncbi:MAG: urate hydroxylase PuuD [Bdellovibrionales bacterium]
MDFALFNLVGLLFVLRWLHIFFGVIWIGLLYYFNFVHGAFMAEAEASAKPSVVQKLLPRALWWFRWGAMYTMITGLTYLMIRAHQMGADFFNNPYGVCITLGAGLGLIMWANVWFVIWPNQKVVIQSATQVATGGQALPTAANSAARALVASRTNVLFSIPMLFFMAASSHLPIMMDENSNLSVMWIILLAVIGALEFNALKGKTGPMTTIKGVVHCGFALTAFFYVVIEIML